MAREAHVTGERKFEATDKAAAQMHKLRDRWADARRQLEESARTASSVADKVRTGLEKAFDDLRSALLESKSKLTSSGRYRPRCGRSLQCSEAGLSARAG